MMLTKGKDGVNKLVKVTHKLAGDVVALGSIPYDFVGVMVFIGPDLKQRTTTHFGKGALIRNRVDNPSQMCSACYDEIIPETDETHASRNRFRVYIDPQHKTVSMKAVQRVFEEPPFDASLVAERGDRHRTRVFWLVVALVSIGVIILVSVMRILI